MTAMKLVGIKGSTLVGHGRQRRVDKAVITWNNLELIQRLTRSIVVGGPQWETIFFGFYALPIK